jgi:hypothetical protein
MAKGFEDWQQNVNIADQRAVQLLSREYFGAALAVYDGILINPGDTRDIVNISNKGIILSGFLYNNPATSGITDEIDVYIDGNLLFWTRIADLINYNIKSDRMSPLYLITYDDVAFKYTIGIGTGYSFENNLQIRYNNTTAGFIQVRISLVYGLT